MYLAISRLHSVFKNMSKIKQSKIPVVIHFFAVIHNTILNVKKLEKAFKQLFHAQLSFKAFKICKL
jgi:hypothetical protein